MITTSRSNKLEEEGYNSQYKVGSKISSKKYESKISFKSKEEEILSKRENEEEIPYITRKSEINEEIHSPNGDDQ